MAPVIPVFDAPYTCIWRPLYLNLTPLIPVFDAPYSCIWRPLCVCLTPLIHVFDAPYSCIWRPLCVCLTPLIHVFDSSFTCIWGPFYVCLAPILCVYDDPFSETLTAYERVAFWWPQWVIKLNEKVLFDVGNWSFFTVFKEYKWNGGILWWELKFFL